MRAGRNGFIAVVLLSLAGCPNRNDDKDHAASTAPATSVAAPATSVSAEPKPDATASKLAIVPRVKSELDGRADGITGTAVAVAGALASLQAPTTWQATKSDFSVEASPDKKAELAAGTFAATETPPTKLPAAATALGLSGCEWGAPEAITVGKSKLPATAADGVCSRGTAQVRAAYVAPTAERLLVVGAWDQDGDSANVFGAMRSIAKAGGGDATGIAACCAALRGNAKVAPPEQQGVLMLAAGACDAARNNPDARAALASVRAALKGANVPSSCK